MSNGMIHDHWSFHEFACALLKFDWLRVDFWIQGPLAADTSCSRTIFDQSDARKHQVSWTLIGRKLFHCAMYLLPLDLISKINFQPIRTCLTHAQFHGMTTGHVSFHWTCIALHSVIIRENKMVFKRKKENKTLSAEILCKATVPRSPKMLQK